MSLHKLTFLGKTRDYDSADDRSECREIDARIAVFSRGPQILGRELRI
jgi:hypothetical protein